MALLRNSIWFLLALLLACSVPDEERSLAEVIKVLNESQPEWLPDLSVCPTSVLPKRGIEISYLSEKCLNNAQQCSSRCETGDANACYALALAIQPIDDGFLSESLFLRSCELGVISGCTNRAAAMIDENRECANMTFEKTCAFQDPWGCTMLGSALSAGDGIEKDTTRALQVLAESCRFGEEDDACRAAQSIITRIGNEK